LSIFRIGIIVGALLFTGCVSVPGELVLKDHVAPSADQLWTPPAVTAPNKTVSSNKIDIPEELMKPGAEWRLADIIQVALQNNPSTKAAWYSARSAAADWLSQKGDYYPDVNAYVSASHALTLDSSDKKGDSGTTSVVSFDPSVQMSWVIFDMGGRDAAVEEKYQTLLAADFTHNATIQDAVFNVIDAYFQYASAKAVKKAYEISMNEAAVNLEAAEKRHENGLATIADVLQMKTALSQARLNLDGAEGDIQTIRGALATAMGIPANTSFDIEDLSSDPPVNTVIETVDEYIKKAQANRPDLAAQRSNIEAALAKVRSAHSARYPTITFSDSLGTGIDNDNSAFKTSNSAAIKLSIPIFQGDSLRYNELKAKEDAEKQKATLEELEQTIVYNVWSSYFNLKTASKKIKTNDDLIESAQQSHDVALGRYKEGVGGYLDLLSAQTSLESAREQKVEATAEWYIYLAQLARDTGMLWRGTDEEQAKILDQFPNAKIKDKDHE